MRLIFQLSAAVLCAAALYRPVFAETCLPREEKKRFVRILKDARSGGQALHTSLITYEPGEPGAARYSVDLISAVHIGERSYYDALNQAFRRYDAVLYELIAPKGADMKMQAHDSGGNLLSILQRALKDTLKLEFQLDGIDYSKNNMVHADMSPDEFMESMEKRGENIFTMIIKLLMRSSELERKNPQMAPEVALLKMFLEPDTKVTLRGLIAHQFEEVEILSEMLDGPEGSTIIGDRNQLALDVLKRELAKGKKKIAIFYGAGHMPDLEKRLIEDFNLRCAGHEWIPAWRL